ncbi:MAG: Gfo/Idh/MocA family oxidoreductase [Planctomycetota bacterium]|nr:Gfo/Idh/MocA family oxidoreductase [Planctomycetota bacterium]
MSGSIDRRQFLGKAAAAGFALGACPGVARAGGAAEKVIVGVMGTNGRGTELARGFAGLDGADVAYVCDVDERAVLKASRAVESVHGRRPRGVGDFRKILDDRAVDALVIAAPDHWHAPATILACAAGKHVYVEKPCSHNPREGELMVEAARKHRVVVQMGNQRRSWEKIIEAMQEIRRGVVGRVYYSRAGYANTRGPIGKGRKSAVPGWLDFDLWQGPAPRREFRDNLLHYNWHWFWHWGTGELGNNGVHTIDLCRWGLGVDFPLRVTSGGGRYHWRDDQETPDTQVVTFDFAGDRSIVWEGLSCNRHGYGGPSFHGESGTVVIEGGGYAVYDKSDKQVKRVSGSRNDRLHYGNFVDCLRSGRRPNADIEGGHQSTLLCHLGNIAQRTGRTLHCDPSNGRIREDRDAMALWGRDYQEGWEPKV